MSFKIKILFLLILFLFLNTTIATYNSYNSTTKTWTNTTLSDMLMHPQGEILFANKLTDYYAYYTFDEDSGTVTNLNTTTGLPLTIYGGTRNSTVYQLYKSLDLNGNNGQYATPGTVYDWTSGDWTISAWIQAHAWPMNDWALGGRWGGNLGYAINIWDTGKIGVYTNANECETPSSEIPNDYNWHHIVAVKNGTTCQIYVDGVSKTVSGSVLTSWTSAGAGYRFEIGTWSNDALGNFNGLIDEWMMWKRALNATEAGNLYSNTYKTYGTVTSFYQAPAGNITNKITVNWTNPYEFYWPYFPYLKTNYTAWYKNSSGGTFTQLSGGTLWGNHTWDVSAFQNTTVEVRSNGSGYATSFGVQISYDLGAATNTPPVLAAIGNQNVTTRSYLNITLNATDANGDTLTFATNASKGTLNNITGEYSWHILVGENGTYYFNFSVSDPYGGSDYEIIRVNVTNSLPFTLPQVYTNWWNTSWTYRATNIVPNGPRPYQLSLNVSNSTGTNNATTIFCNGHCNVNFTDIRFTLDNGTALPFWIENVTTGKVWVNLTANGTVNMYYGKTNQTTSTSDGNTTFIIFDDFFGTSLNTTKWTLGGSGTYTVSGGELYLNGTREIKSKSTYSSGYFMRARAKRATNYKEWLVGFMTIGDGAESKMSVPLDHNVDNPPNANITCVNGKDNQVYIINAYNTARDAAYHIGEFRRGGTQDTCILDDLQAINPIYPSTISRYLIADTYNGASFYLDYIMLGYYSLIGSAWGTWGAEQTGSAGVEYIPPIPVLALETNASDYSWRYIEWSEGWGNTTDAYIVGLNDVYTVNTHIESLNETLVPHEYMNVSVYSFNYSNSTVNMTPYDNFFQRPNNIPYLYSIGNKSIYQNNTLSFNLTAIDFDFDTILFGTNASKGTLSSSSCFAYIGGYCIGPYASYSFTSTPADVGNYSWYFNASDGYSGLDTEIIKVQVRAPRTISLPIYNTGWQNVFVNNTQSMASLDTLYDATYIAVWNSSTQEWEKYKSDWEWRQNQTVSRDVGIMILTNSNATKNIIINNTFNWTLNIGQNLIGIPENITLSQINTSVNIDGGCQNVDEITYVYPNNQTEKTYTCQNGAGQTNASILVREGHAVWMNALQNKDIKNIMG